MPSDGNHRASSSGRSYSNSTSGSYGNSNYESGSGYNSRHGRYQSEGWTGNGYSNYNRYDRSNSGSNGYLANNPSNVPPKQYSTSSPAASDRSSRAFGQHYTNGSSYIPTRKWSNNTYQPIRSEGINQNYNKKPSYKSQTSYTTSQTPIKPISETNRQQFTSKTYQPRQSLFKQNIGGKPVESTLKQRGRNAPIRSNSNKSYDFAVSSSPSKSNVLGKDIEDLFAQKWNVSYPNDSRGYGRDFEYGEKPYYEEFESRYGHSGRLERNHKTGNSSNSFNQHNQKIEERKINSERDTVETERKSIDTTITTSELFQKEAAANGQENTNEIIQKPSESSECKSDIQKESADVNEDVRQEPTATGREIEGDVNEGIKEDIKSDASSLPVVDLSLVKSINKSIHPKPELEQLPEPEKQPEINERENQEMSTSDEISLQHHVKSTVIVDSNPAIVGGTRNDRTTLDESSVVPSLESVVFPMTEFNDKIWQLKNTGKSQMLKQLPHLLEVPVQIMKDYVFYNKNELIHSQSKRTDLLKILGSIQYGMVVKKNVLLSHYKRQSALWEARQIMIQDQLKDLYPKDNKSSISGSMDDAGVEEDTTDTRRLQNPNRRSRHGDTVRSEAEFLEILKNLEQEKENDPLYRSEKVAAKIPDMFLSPVKLCTQFKNVNNLVIDKEKWASRIHTDGLDNFTRKEHELFCESFLQYPKRFGKISALMGGLRTTEECVLHYYRTKKTLTDYKQMLQMKKKRTRKVPFKVKRGVKNKTPNTSTPNTPTFSGTIIDSETEKDFNIDNFIPQEAMLSEDVYTDTGRRKRAAAPVFDSQEKLSSLDRKTSLAIIERDQQSSEPEQKQYQKQQAKKKPKIQKPKTSNPDSKTNSYTLDSNDTQISNSTSVSTDDDAGGAHKVEDDAAKSHISSYWSVKDSHLFVKLLSEYGTDWNLLAEKLKTKSPIMVRNYYQRNTETLKLQQVASNAANVLSRGLVDHTTTGNMLLPSAGQPETPPLGVFTAHSTIPSNVQFTDKSQVHKNLLPDNLSQPSIFVNERSRFLDSDHKPSVLLLDQHSTNIVSKEPPKNEAAVSRRKQNPFSITNLLNPSDEHSSSPTLSPSPFDSNYEQPRIEMGPFLNPSGAVPPKLAPMTEVKIIANQDGPCTQRSSLDLLLSSNGTGSSSLPTTRLPSLVRTNPMSISNALGEATDLYCRNVEMKTTADVPLETSNIVHTFKSTTDLKRPESDKFGCP